MAQIRKRMYTGQGQMRALDYIIVSTGSTAGRLHSHPHRREVYSNRAKHKTSPFVSPWVGSRPPARVVKPFRKPISGI